MFGIRNAHADYVIDSRFQIHDFIVTPVGKNRALEFLAAAGAAAIVNVEHGIAIGGENLPLKAKGVRVLSVRAAVNAQQQRHFRALRVSQRISQQSVNICAVGSFVFDVFGLREIEFGKKFVILMRQLA